MNGGDCEKTDRTMANNLRKKKEFKIDQPSYLKGDKNGIIDEKRMKKSKNRWNQFTAAVKEIHQDALKGPVLDFGCGMGYFVYYGLSQSFDVWGVDLSKRKICRYRELIQNTGGPKGWEKRCIIANGLEMPFKSNLFAAVSSWYVLEHLEDLGGVLREVVRVTQRGGVLILKAQDARNGWEGHCKIPWLPFLSGNLSRAWAEEFGKSYEERRGVYDITEPQVTAILEACGCEIVAKAPPPIILIREHWQINTEQEVRVTARKVKAMMENNQWQPQPENLIVYAVKQ